MSTPCNECPFRKTSAPGYLGESSYNPIAFLETIEHGPIPCHKAVDWDNVEIIEEDDLYDLAFDHPCKGSLIFQQPRMPDYNKLVKEVQPSIDVFSNKQAFINHHQKLPLNL